ncbi:hypothetical protein GCM10010116_61640 [Microbispora rosea subsp. aerata]|nr:hypothetical protein GCM10010116_61640 [Microbispora rosea subsp. aerata]GIH59136.1 hypothetical protein Mro02_60500 [Microbispora rosea subsp. aerata]GLJ87111.1 hypothetical protein GCM10017588_58550 [Microbispora rosea subsp. aerata]
MQAPAPGSADLGDGGQQGTGLRGIDNRTRIDGACGFRLSPLDRVQRIGNSLGSTAASSSK